MFQAKLSRTNNYDFENWFCRRDEWSMATFGPSRGFEGALDHLKKEVTEIEKSPYDTEEWIDALFLVTDGLCRMLRAANPDLTGADAFEIMMEVANRKLDKNMRREWPSVSEQIRGKAVEHVRGKHD